MLVAIKRVCVSVHAHRDRATDGKESFLYTLAILILLINTDLFPYETACRVERDPTSPDRRYQMRSVCISPVVYDGNISEGRACSLIYLFLLNIKCSGEAGELSSICYVLINARDSCVHGGSFFSIGQNLNSLPTHYLLRPWSAEPCLAQ